MDPPNGRNIPEAWSYALPMERQTGISEGSSRYDFTFRPPGAFSFPSQSTPTRVTSANFKPPLFTKATSSNASPSFSGSSRVFYFPGISEEEYPQSPFFSPEFQMCLINGMQIGKQSVAILSQLLLRQRSVKSAEINSETAVDLMNDLKRVSDFQLSTARTIGFLGNSGEGKSSVINSLLNFPNLATVGDVGEACTSIVTEYRQRESGQIQSVKVEVEYFSSSGIKDHLHELLWSFRRTLLPGLAAESEDVAYMTKCRTESNQSDGAFERLLNQLYQWTETIPWPKGASNGKWIAYAENAEECYEKTRPFTRDRLWPFTHIIRIYVDAPILKMGLVLVDLPGLLDVNFARVRSTQEYISRCEHIFLVAKIGRAITDQSLKSSLYAAIASHAPRGLEASVRKGLQIAIICTNSESNISSHSGRSVRGPNTIILASQIDDPDEKIRAAKQDDNRELKKDLKRQKEKLLIEARNTHVRDGLRSAYVEKFKNANLNVFCVSYTWYEKYKQKEKTKATLKLVTTSGIPELRKYCYFLCAESRYDEAEHFLRSTLASIISSIGVNSKPTSFSPLNSSIEDSAKLQQTKLLASGTTDLYSAYLLTDNRHAYWEKAAIEKGLEWSKWHWMQQLTWCHKNGKARTFDGKLIDWNSEIIWKMRAELDMQWDLLEEEMPVIFERLKKSILRLFQTLKAHLQAHGFPSAMVCSIDHRADSITSCVESSKRDFESQLRGIRVKTLESNESSYILQEMITVYRAVVSYRGPHPEMNLQDQLHCRIRNGTLFPNISFAVSRDIDRCVSNDL